MFCNLAELPVGGVSVYWPGTVLAYKTVPTGSNDVSTPFILPKVITSISLPVLTCEAVKPKAGMAVELASAKAIVGVFPDTPLI